MAWGLGINLKLMVDLPPPRILMKNDNEETHE